MTMSDEEHEAEPTPFPGYQELSQQYQRKIKRLKTGESSGISHTFGSAKDLLPSKYLKEYEGFRAGDSVVSEGADPSALRQALEQLVMDFAGETAWAKEHHAGAAIEGVFFDNGQKYVMLADGSMISAEDEPPADEIPDAIDRPAVAEVVEPVPHATTLLREPAAAPDYPCEPIEPTDRAREMEPASQEGMMPFEPQTTGGGVSDDLRAPTGTEPAPQKEDVPRRQRTATDDLGESGKPLLVSQYPDEARQAGPAQTSEREFPAEARVHEDATAQLDYAPESEGGLTFESLWSKWHEGDVKVVARDGRKLWYVCTDDYGIHSIVFHDRRLLSRIENDLYALYEFDSAGIASLTDYLTAVTVHPETGNLAYQTLNGEVTTAWLNNGSCIQHFSGDGGGAFYVTDPSGQSRFRAYDLDFDTASNTVRYQSEDGSQRVTIQCHSLYRQIP
ncbi:MAG TPA: hypothetical protein V6D08_14300 [Candidatus Obscuribacterales bacterium]